MKKVYSVIRGTGSYVPQKVISNADFRENDFFDKNGDRFESETSSIIQKFYEITDIKARRHIEDDHTTSDLGYLAAQSAIDDWGGDPETLDHIIVAHNFGDINKDKIQTDVLPSLASRIKEKLGIENPSTIAYDLIFGCPGWVQGIIQADCYIRSGEAKKVMVIGADALSRISDPHDRDSMIYADGAAATILEAVESDTPVGILAHRSRTDANGQTYNLYLGKSFNADKNNDDNLYIKMHGHKIYTYALSNVPALVKESLDKANVGLHDVKKILIHQANAKMDEAILKRLFRLYKETEIPEDIMPMTISEYGNSSVATIPTLLDHILKGELESHSLNAGEVAVLTSVGAGMNINSVVYKFPE